jgi:glyceraldehyde 3-phosphate dehydrogenase
MSPVKVAINGCGRIGRLAFRAAFDQADKFEFVQLNDLASAESTAYLIQFDSVHGTLTAAKGSLQDSDRQVQNCMQLQKAHHLGR